MISEEKLMMRLLRDYYICKLYTQTYISSRNISSLVNISPASVKRALHIVEEKKEACKRLLPLAFKKAIEDGIINSEEYIDEEVLDSLQLEIDMATLQLKKQNKWLTSSIEFGNDLLVIIENINNKYCSNNRNIALTVNQVKKLRAANNSYGKISEELGIAKSSVFNYYNRSDDYEEEVALKGEIGVKSR